MSVDLTDETAEVWRVRAEAAEEDYETLLALATDKHSGCNLAKRERERARQAHAPEQVRAFDAGFHAGWEAHREVIASAAAGNRVHGHISGLRERVREQREQITNLNARAERHARERKRDHEERQLLKDAMRKFLSVHGGVCPCSASSLHHPGCPVAKVLALWSGGEQ